MTVTGPQLAESRGRGSTPRKANWEELGREIGYIHAQETSGEPTLEVIEPARKVLQFCHRGVPIPPSDIRAMVRNTATRYGWAEPVGNLKGRVDLAEQMAASGLPLSGHPFLATSGGVNETIRDIAHATRQLPKIGTPRLSYQAARVVVKAGKMCLGVGNLSNSQKGAIESNLALAERVAQEAIGTDPKLQEELKLRWLADTAQLAVPQVPQVSRPPTRRSRSPIRPPEQSEGGAGSGEAEGGEKGDALSAAKEHIARLSQALGGTQGALETAVGQRNQLAKLAGAAGQKVEQLEAALVRQAVAGALQRRAAGEQIGQALAGQQVLRELAGAAGQKVGQLETALVRQAVAGALQRRAAGEQIAGVAQQAAAYRQAYEELAARVRAVGGNSGGGGGRGRTKGNEGNERPSLTQKAASVVGGGAALIWKGAVLPFGVAGVVKGVRAADRGVRAARERASSLLREEGELTEALSQAGSSGRQVKVGESEATNDAVREMGGGVNSKEKKQVKARVVKTPPWDFSEYPADGEGTVRLAADFQELADRSAKQASAGRFDPKLQARVKAMRDELGVRNLLHHEDPEVLEQIRKAEVSAGASLLSSVRSVEGPVLQRKEQESGRGPSQPSREDLPEGTPVDKSGRKIVEGRVISSGSDRNSEGLPSGERAASEDPRGRELSDEELASLVRGTAKPGSDDVSAQTVGGEIIDSSPRPEGKRPEEKRADGKSMNPDILSQESAALGKFKRGAAAGKIGC